MGKRFAAIFASVSYIILTATAEQTCNNVSSTLAYKGRYFENTTINLTSSVFILTTPSVYACHHVCTGRADCNALSYNTSHHQLMNCKLFNEKRYERYMVRRETSVAILLLPIHCGYNAARDGEWSSWVPAGACYGNCNCKQIQTRECVNAPTCGGDECAGPITRKVLCATNYTQMNIVGFPCEQSSTLHVVDDACEVALDGRMSSGQTTQTQEDTNPWWQVDLGTPQTIAALVIYNSLMSTNVTLRLDNFLVQARNVSESTAPTTASKSICVKNQSAKED